MEMRSGPKVSAGGGGGGGGVRQDHVWCIFAESAITFPIDFVWKLEPAISISLYPVWQILVLN